MVAPLIAEAASPPELKGEWPSAAPAPQQTQQHAQSKRDTAVEDEIFHCGYFADVAFRFSGFAGEVEEIYGQRALFSLLSPVLRGVLLPNGGTSCNDDSVVQAGGGRLQVTLDSAITARAFREVARYVYRLPPRLSLEVLPEVLLAARLLSLDELEESTLAWGLANLGGPATSRAASPSNSGGDSGPRGADAQDEATLTMVSSGHAAIGSVDAALSCLERLCTLDPQPDGTEAWRQALLQTFSSEQIFASATFLTLSPCTMRGLLLGDFLHADPGVLWLACVDWATALAGHPSCVGSRLAAPASPREPAAAPRRLFGCGARLAGALAPAAPGEAQVSWQEPLLSVVDLVRFWKMPAKDFATHVEALNPMMPQLRQAIYASRRRGVAKEGPEEVE